MPHALGSTQADMRRSCLSMGAGRERPEEPSWLGTEESNPHVQIQNLLSYH